MQGLREVVLIRGGGERAFTGRHFMTLVAFCPSSELHSSSILHQQGHIVDIVRVLAADGTPLFPPHFYLFPPHDCQALSSNYRPTARRLSALWRKSFPNQHDLANVLDDLVAFSSSLEFESARASDEMRLTLALRMWQCSSHQALLSLQDDDSTTHQWMLQEPFRHAALIYLYEVTCNEGLSFMLQTHPHMLRHCLEMGRDVDWAAFELLRLWVLTIGALSALSPEKEWFVQELAKILKCLGKSFWTQMKEVKKILWNDEIYDKRAQAMFAELEKPATVMFNNPWTAEKTQATVMTDKISTHERRMSLGLFAASGS